MGFLDNVASAVNRGTASVQRSGKTAQLKMQMNELMKQRRDLAAQLGASVYDTVKDMPEIRKGRETIFLSIEDVDKQRSEIEAQIAQIEAEAAAQQEASTTYACPKCGSQVLATDMFCSGCGMPIEEVKAAAGAVDGRESSDGPQCPKCGAVLDEDDVFCMSCGAKIEAGD